MAYPGSRSHTFVADEEVLAGTLNAWGPPNVSWGLVAAPVSISAAQAGITAMADITSAAATWTSVNGRWYEVTFTGRLLQVTTAGIQTLELQTGASGAGTRFSGVNSIAVVNAAAAGLGFIAGFIQGDGNSLSVHARATTTAGTLTIDNTVTAAKFLVKDIGLNAP